MKQVVAGVGPAAAGTDLTLELGAHHPSTHGSLVSTDAEIFTARACCASDSVRSFDSDTSTTAAAPSPVGQHIGSVFG